jgi:hypothetical protein
VIIDVPVCLSTSIGLSARSSSLGSITMTQAWWVCSSDFFVQGPCQRVGSVGVGGLGGVCAFLA